MRTGSSDSPGVATVSFGVVEDAVGGVEECALVARSVGGVVECDADTRPDRGSGGGVIVGPAGTNDLLDQGFRHDDGAFSVDIGEDHCELVAADAGDLITGP